MAPGFSSEIQTKATKDPGNDIKNILSLEPSFSTRDWYLAAVGKKTGDEYSGRNEADCGINILSKPF